MKEIKTTYLALALSLGVIIGLTAGKLIMQPKIKPSFNVVHKEPKSSGPIAKILGKEYSEKDVFGENNPEIDELRSQEYEIKMRNVKAFAEEVILTDLATKAGKSIELFVEENVINGKDEPTDADYRQFVIENNIPKDAVNDFLKDKIKDRLVELKREKLIAEYVMKQTKENPVEVYFPKPYTAPAIIDGNSPYWGRDTAPVKLTIFSDFECPACKSLAGELDKVKERVGKNDLKIVFKHFPLPFHKNAPDAHEAAVCSQQVGGNDGFWKFHDVLFGQNQGFSRSNMQKYAESAGLKKDEFYSCMESGKARAVVDEDVRFGNALRVDETPTIYINGVKYHGALDSESILLELNR